MAAARVALTRPRKIATGSLGLVHLLLAFAYSQPALSVAPPSPGQIRVSVVNYINNLGPVWLVAFGVTGAALITALLLAPRWLGPAHVGGVLVTSFYSIALWSGFVLSTPRPTIIAATLSVTLVLWHVAMSDLYAAPPPRPSRARHRGGAT